MAVQKKLMAGREAAEEPFVYQIAENLRQFVLTHSGENAVDFSIGTPPTSLAIRMKQLDLLFGTSEDPFKSGSMESWLFEQLQQMVYGMGRYEMVGGRDELREKFLPDDAIARGLSSTVISGGVPKALDLWKRLQKRFAQVRVVVSRQVADSSSLASEKTLVLMSDTLMERCSLAVVIGPLEVVNALQALHIAMLGTPSSPQEDLYFLLSQKKVQVFLESGVLIDDGEENCLSEVLEFLSLVYCEPLANLREEGSQLRRNFLGQFVHCLFPKLPKQAVLSVMGGNGGSRQAMVLAEEALRAQGVEQMILFKPHWSYHNVYPDLKLVSLATESDGQPDFDLLENTLKKLTCSGKKANTALTINSPNNPSGVVYSQKSLEKLLKLAEKYQAYVVDDACYIHILRGSEKSRKTLLEVAYEMVKAKSLKSEFLQKIMVALTASKGLGMAGGRLGAMLYSDESFTEIFADGYSAELPNLMAFFLADKLTADPKAYLDLLKTINEEIDARVKKVAAILDRHGLQYKKPAGAFYIEVQVPFLKDKVKDMKSFALQIAREKGIGFMPMEVFGGDQFAVRLSLGGEKVLEQLQQETEILLTHLDEIKP